MPDIKDSVGEGGSNQVHDVALLQAMLRVVKDAKNAPYLGVDYDGSYGAQTRAALERFQNDCAAIPIYGSSATARPSRPTTAKRSSTSCPATRRCESQSMIAPSASVSC